MPRHSPAKDFWNARARENALYFVDNRVDYANPDESQFWTEGERDAATLLELAGAELRSTDDVVEIGCGVGRLTRSLAAQAASVRALDVSPEMLALARQYNPSLGGVTWIEGDGTSLAGIEDSSADACVSHVVFQHIPDAAITLGYIEEMGRVLRPGGWSVFQVSNDERVHEQRPSPKARLVALLGRAPRGQTHPNWRGSHIDLDDLRAAAARGGMDVESVYGEGTQYCVVRLRRRATP